MGSISTYIVLATASLSVTYLAFLLYSAYGFAAFKAAAPFIGTVTLVFAAAHCLDLANESKDAEARDAKGLTAAAAAAAPVSTAGARGARGAAPMPKRRRVAD